MNTKRIARRPGLIASVDCGNVGTGTDSVPSPRSPLTVMRTCQAPAPISHKWPVNSLRIVVGACRAIRNGRELRAVAGQRQRHDVHFADIVAGRQHIDIGNAGNGMRRPDRDEQSIWAGVGLEKHVGAADMRARRRLQRRARDAASAATSGGARRHRRTFCIARPSVHAEPRHEPRDQRRDGHAAPEQRRRRLPIEEFIARQRRTRRRREIDIAAAEEPVARRGRHHEIGERPLHRDEHREERDADHERADERPPGRRCAA